MYAVYLKDFNDLNWMNVGLNKKVDYAMADYLCNKYNNIWSLLKDIQKKMNIEPTPAFDDFWEGNMSRIEFYEEMGRIEK